MKNMLFRIVNQKLIKGGVKSNLNKINNNIDKDYEVTSSNTSLS